MRSILSHFHEPAGFLYHGGALLYALGGYVVGLAGLFADSGWINALATLWLLRESATLVRDYSGARALAVFKVSNVYLALVLLVIVIVTLI